MRHGHVKLSRKMFDGSDLFWSEPRVFSRAEAWIDLIQLAAWRDGAPYSTAKHGTDILARGEFVASLRFLAERWQWGKWKVQHFLDALQQAGRIAGHRTGQHGTVYLIANYATYQSGGSEDRTASQTPSRTGTGQRPDKEEAVKTIKQENPSLGASDDAPAESGHAERNDYPAEFEACWRAYPKRPNHSKRDAHKAWAARVRAGVSPEALLAGTERYKAYCDAEEKTGTEWVKQAATFYGPGGHYLLPWEARRVRPAVASGGATADDPTLPMLGALSDAGLLTADSLSSEEYRRRVDALAPVLGYTTADFRALVKRIKPWDLGRIAFEPERRREFARRLATAQRESVTREVAA